MSGVCLKRVPSVNGGPRVYRVQRGEGKRAQVLGFVTERGDSWDALNMKFTLGRFASCKLAIRALEQAAELGEMAA